jgi:hypothetical protein
VLLSHRRLSAIYRLLCTTDNHELTFLYAGFSTSRQYRYWDPVKRGVDFEGMIEDLRQSPENSVVILQVCAHNPTGCDLTKEQWTQVADVMQVMCHSVRILSHVSGTYHTELLERMPRFESMLHEMTDIQRRLSENFQINSKFSRTFYFIV